MFGGGIGIGDVALLLLILLLLLLLSGVQQLGDVTDPFHPLLSILSGWCSSPHAVMCFLLLLMLITSTSSSSVVGMASLCRRGDDTMIILPRSRSRCVSRTIFRVNASSP